MRASIRHKWNFLGNPFDGNNGWNSLISIKQYSLVKPKLILCQIERLKPPRLYDVHLLNGRYRGLVQVIRTQTKGGTNFIILLRLNKRDLIERKVVNIIQFIGQTKLPFHITPKIKSYATIYLILSCTNNYEINIIVIYSTKSTTSL